MDNDETRPAEASAELPPPSADIAASTDSSAETAIKEAVTGAAPENGSKVSSRSAVPELPPHYELTRDSDGRDQWKLTCFCGKRILTPTDKKLTQGRCPKCLRRLRLPIAPPPEKPRPASKPEPVTEAQAQKEMADALGLDFPHDVPHVEGSVNFQAAAATADRLRPHHRQEVRRTASGSGFISAWPVAGKLRRGLAAFLDLTLIAILVGFTAILADYRKLPPVFVHAEVLIVVGLILGFINDVVIHFLIGASVGKKLIVLVLRHESGKSPTPLQVLLRSFLKWTLIPGWILGALDMSDRTLHDLLTQTLVLKGRVRHRS